MWFYTKSDCVHVNMGTNKVEKQLVSDKIPFVRILRARERSSVWVYNVHMQYSSVLRFSLLIKYNLYKLKRKNFNHMLK